MKLTKNDLIDIMLDPMSFCIPYLKGLDMSSAELEADGLQIPHSTLRGYLNGRRGSPGPEAVSAMLAYILKREGVIRVEKSHA